MPRIREEDYAYAAARVRVKETKLLSRNRLDRLFEITDTADAIKFLAEAGYGPNSLGAERGTEEDIEMILASEMKKVYKFLLEILPDPQVLSIFKRQYDYLNAKLIIKAEMLGIDVRKSLSSMGLIRPLKLIGYISDRKFDELPAIMADGIVSAFESFNRTRNPQDIDFILDRACYDNMAEDAKNTQDPFLIELVQKLADTANIKVFIRAKLLSKSEEFVKRVLVNAGRLPEEIFEGVEKRSLEQFFSGLKGAGLEELAGELTKVIDTGGTISDMERILDDSIMCRLKKDKYLILGVQPVISYLFFKETEIRNIRLIITGIRNRVPRETISERLRLGYA